jgi:hypothetical protein
MARLRPIRIMYPVKEGDSAEEASAADGMRKNAAAAQ